MSDGALMKGEAQELWRDVMEIVVIELAKAIDQVVALIAMEMMKARRGGSRGAGAL